MGVTKIVIDIAVNAGRAAGEIDATASSMDKFRSGMGQMAAPAAAALGAIGGLAMGAAKAASDLQQASGGVDAVFKTAAGSVHQWATTSAQDVGLASSEYKTMAASIGGALTGMGVPLDDAAQATHDLMLRSADLASVFGGTTAQASEAVTSAFRGEYDALQRLIPSMSASAVEAQMAAEASQGMTYASEDAAKAAAITNLIMSKSADAAGNFAKESDTAAGAQARAQAEFKNTAAALGEQLLPLITTLMGWFSKIGQWISENIPLVTTLAAVIGGLAAAVLLINGAMAVYSAAQTVATVATGLWSAAAGLGATATAAFGAAMALLTSPITLVVLAIAAVIAIVVLLVKNWDTVSAAAAKCWDFIKGVIDKFVSWVGGVIDSAISGIKSAWEGLKSFFSGLWDWIKNNAQVIWDVILTIILGPIYLIIKNFDKLKEVALGVWEAIKSAGTAIWGAIKNAATSALDAIMWPINKIKDAISWVISQIQKAIGFAQNLMSKIPFIGGLFSSSAPQAAQSSASRYLVPAGGGTPMLSRSLLAGAGNTTVVRGSGTRIVVNGALDPVAVARQIGQIMLQQNRRQYGVTVSDRGGLGTL